MKRIGNISHEKYEPKKIDAIFKRLELASKTNQAHDYEIAIDQLTIVARTSDLDRFDSLSEFITADSDCLVIYTYYGASKQYDTHFFYFKSVPAHKMKNQTLSGNLSFEEFQKEQKERISKELHYETLETENQELKNKLEESEQKFKDESRHWENIKNGRIENYGEIGSALIASLLSNPNLKKMFPILGTFGNFGQTVQDNPLGNTPPQQEASFKRKQSPSQNQQQEEQTIPDQSNEQDIAYLNYIKFVTKKFDDQQLPVLMKIIRLLITCPVALKSTRKHIENFIKSKPKESKP